MHCYALALSGFRSIAVAGICISISTAACAGYYYLSVSYTFVALIPCLCRGCDLLNSLMIVYSVIH